MEPLKIRLLERPEIIVRLMTWEMTYEEAAKIFNVSVDHLTHTVIDLVGKRKPAPKYQKRKLNSELAATRKDFRLSLAYQVVNGSLSIEAAAKQAKCSERTIYRYIDRINHE